MAPLDVESLFTNVPVRRTIDIILDYVYENNALSPLNVPKTSPKSMLEVCTLETSFRYPEGKLYIQKDCVAIGSPLGVFCQNICHM